MLASVQGWLLMDDLATPQEALHARDLHDAIGEVRRGAEQKSTPKPIPGATSKRRATGTTSPCPGETHVLLDQQGPGVITHMWITFLGPEPQDWAKQGRPITRRCSCALLGWQTPAGRRGPLGRLLCKLLRPAPQVVRLPVVVDDGDAYNCFWRMPFRKSASIEIVNESEKPISLLYYNIDWIKKAKLPKDTPYFYAQYRQEYPAEHGKDYLLLDTKGKGHYVGTVLAVRTRSPSCFGEGDEKIYIDGEAKASVWGTGTEDYFLCAWGLKQTSTPYFGVPYFDQWGIVGSHTSAYRWHLNDPIVFNKGIKVTFEHFGWIPSDENPNRKTTSWNEREDDYASVAFWYQTGQPTFTARAPHARERKLPSLERITAYARDFTDAQHHGVGEVTPQQLDFYDGPQLLYKPKEAGGAWLEVPFEVKRKEPLRLLLNLTKAPDFGQYQALLNGVKLGAPMDGYNAKVVNEEFHLLDIWPEPGTYTLRLECVGKNQQSTGYYLGLESVRLRERRPRVSAYGFKKTTTGAKTRSSTTERCLTRTPCSLR